MNLVDKQYQGFLRKLIMYGNEKKDRTGTGTYSRFGLQITYNKKDGHQNYDVRIKMVFRR